MSQNASQQHVCKNLHPRIIDFLDKMRDMGQQRSIPNISWDTANFFREFLSKRDITNILEIGPANGFSTMILSIACPKAHITSLECSRHAFEELRHNIGVFQKLQTTNYKLQTDFFPADLSPKVTSDIFQEDIGQFSLYFGDAREIMPAFLEGSEQITCIHPASTLHTVPQQKFDCIFIDGAFRMTREFFDLSRPLLTSDGIIIIDDAIKYRWKMDGFHEYLEEQGIAYTLIQTDEDDGVMVIDFGNISVHPA